MKNNMTVNFGNLLLTLSEALDLADSTIYQHQHRTAFVAVEIAKYYGASPEMIERIFCAALLHDVGAISVEEKISIHNSCSVDKNLHGKKGELLLEQTPWLSNISKIVGNHHRVWLDWENTIEDPIVFASQVIFLADFLECNINRNKYILHQIDDLIEIIRKLSDVAVNKKIVCCFLELSKREKFWLDLVSPRLYSKLLYDGPLYNIEIGYDKLSLVADLFRDIIDFKSNFTATHTSGVSACAELLSSLYGFSKDEAHLMKIAGNFHDIGKLVIPNSILEKQGRLTKEEYDVIKSHAYYTSYILDSIGGLEKVSKWASNHHEKLDGNGYPFHFKDSEIDMGSRIMSVADIYTAISEDRPYRKGMDKNRIYDIFKESTNNKLLDSKVVDLLFDNYDKVSTHVLQRQLIANTFYEDKFRKVINI